VLVQRWLWQTILREQRPPSWPRSLPWMQQGKYLRRRKIECVSMRMHAVAPDTCPAAEPPTCCEASVLELHGVESLKVSLLVCCQSCVFFCARVGSFVAIWWVVDLGSRHMVQALHSSSTMHSLDVDANCL
jgi:hypothetical protein